jgi:hypothetical protein
MTLAQTLGFHDEIALWVLHGFLQQPSLAVILGS